MSVDYETDGWLNLAVFHGTAGNASDSCHKIHD